MERSSRSRSQKKLTRTCFVPGCITGYRSCKTKVSLFQAPKDLQVLEKWRKLIQRADKVLDETCAVCANHFEPHFIERYYRTVVNGEEVLLPRGRPRLRKDAVPTIFPNLSECFTKPLSKKRSLREIEDPTKQPTEIKMYHKTLDEILSVKLPSTYWSTIKYKNTSDVVSFLCFDHYEKNTDIPDKKIVVRKKSDQLVHVTTTLKGTEVNSLVLPLTEFQNLLVKIDRTNVCSGIGSYQDFCEVLATKLDDTKYFVDGTVLRQVTCEGFVEKVNSKCYACIRTWKILMTMKTKVGKEYVNNFLLDETKP